jgi:dipeptidyl aminopeptidase/acylaminoacyl peptidase
VPVEIFLFPGEGHGFRSGAVQAQVLEATEAFFRRHLGLPR